MTPFPNLLPDQSSARTTTRAIHSVRLGNGYEQRVPVGLNYRRDRWELSWSNLTEQEKDVLVSFLEAISDGSVALWTSPLGGGERKYVLDGDWSITFPSGNLFNISANFIQVFDLDV